MINEFRKLAAVLMITCMGLLGVGVTGCAHDGGFENAGEEVDDAIEETGDSIEEATD